MDNMSLEFISGWVISAISLLYAFYSTHKNRIEQIKLNNTIHSLQGELLSSNEHQRTLASTIHDICFNSLMQVKNYPNDSMGFMLQRETLVSCLKSLQRIAQSYGKDQLFQGSFVIGSELSAHESTEPVTNIWILTYDLMPERDDPEILKIVASNIKKGKKYVYIYPDYISKKIPEEMLDNLRSCFYDENSSFESGIEFVPFSMSENQGLIQLSTVVIYESLLNIEARDRSPNLLGFEEIIVPDERRGGLWRRQADEKAKSMLGYMKVLRNNHHEK